MQKITKKESGFTLVELMVAITLGFILTFAVIQTFFATRQTARANDGVARIQENARFSLQFLTEDVRNSGYGGCVGKVRNKLIGEPNAFLSFTNPIFGWEAAGTEPGANFTLTGAVANTANWTGTASPGFANTALPGFFGAQLITGSDVIGLSMFERVDANISASNSLSRTITTSAAHEVDANSMVLVGDCWQSELFQNSTAGTTLTAAENAGVPGNRTLSPTIGWLRPYTSNDQLFQLGYKFYFVAQGAGTLPSLYSFETSQPLGLVTAADVTNNRRELVEGVESMQILYGEDTSTPADGNPNRYVAADDVTNWINVVSTRVGLLLQSPNNATDIDQANNYVLLDNITLSHGADDAILRYLVNTTVKLRNKGLDANVAAFVCNAGTAECP